MKNRVGRFTYVPAEGLRGKAGQGKTGHIKITELAEKVFKSAQYPTISISGQAFPIGKVK